MTADSKRARFSAAAVPTWHFSCLAWLCLAGCNKDWMVRMVPMRQWVPWAELSMSFALPCLLMLGLPCLLPFPLPCSLLCHARVHILFSEISFLFVIPFCGSTKRVGPFVLPQKGRTVPSLFLLLLSQIFGSLETPTGAIFGERGYSGFGYGGGVGQGRFQNL